MKYVLLIMVFTLVFTSCGNGEKEYSIETLSILCKMGHITSCRTHDEMVSYTKHIYLVPGEDTVDGVNFSYSVGRQTDLYKYEALFNRLQNLKVESRVPEKYLSFHTSMEDSILEWINESKKLDQMGMLAFDYMVQEFPNGYSIVAEKGPLTCNLNERFQFARDNLESHERGWVEDLGLRPYIYILLEQCVTRYEASKKANQSIGRFLTALD